MTIEVINTSGQLVPATEINSLLTFALLELQLNPECEINVSFVDDDYMTELHITWMDEPGTTDLGPISRAFIAVTMTPPSVIQVVRPRSTVVTKA